MDFKSIMIKKDTLHERIAEEIQKRILEEKIHSGTKLPPERTMAEELGVTRNTLREAIRILEQRGLLKMKSGLGTFVIEVSPKSITKSINFFKTYGQCSYLEILELRRMIEPQIIESATNKYKDSDLKKLDKIIKEINDAFIKDDFEKYTEADEKFHEMIAEITNNNLIIAILTGLEPSLKDLRKEMRGIILKEDLDTIINAYNCLKNNDSIGARDNMLKHLDVTIDAYKSREK